jgi:hypothetical protein
VEGKAEGYRWSANVREFDIIERVECGEEIEKQTGTGVESNAIGN